ncbi:MAG: glycogen-binding domain-containing protein, partial [Gemmatimonadaceae bacterium]
TLRFTLPAARSAGLLGDFTGWTAVPLERGADGRWAVTLALGPGVHRVNLRTDDGPWRAPPGLTAVDDGFGGQVGLLVVSR